MIFRMLFLLSLIGAIGHDTGSPSSNQDVEDQRMGGEGFGNVVSLVALIGVAVLAAIVILAILALTGHFENDSLNPVV